jgi:uncharacterized protein DUF2846
MQPLGNNDPRFSSSLDTPENIIILLPVRRIVLNHFSLHLGARSMSKPLSLLGFLVLAALTGCAASGPPFQAVSPPPEQAVIYVFRPSASYVGSGIGLDILCDGQKVGTLLETGYVYTVVPAGRHTITCQTESLAQVPFQAEPGKSYYIQADVEIGIIEGRPKLTMVPEETGKLAILSTKLSGTKS